MNSLEIDTAYPIRNKVWTFDRMTGRWVVEASSLKPNGFLDPWNRPFPQDKFREVYDPRGEDVELWVYQTTVAGNPVECVVLND